MGGGVPIPTGNIPESELPTKKKVNGGGQECPPHTMAALLTSKAPP